MRSCFYPHNINFSFFKFKKMETIKEKDRIEIGSKVPNLKLYNQNGSIFNIKNILGKKNIILFFFVNNSSDNCIKQACYFRDKSHLFDHAECEIIGVSSNSVESQKEFATKYNLNFTLLSDDENIARTLFEVHNNFHGFTPGRVSFIIDKFGYIIYIIESQTQISRHIDEALEILREMH